MQVYLDNEPYELTCSEQMTIGQVVDQVKTALPDRQRMLVAVRCDGQDVAPDRLDTVLGESVDRYEKLELETSSPWDLAASALSGAGELFSETQGLIEQTVDLLNQGQTTRAMDLLGNCLRVWNQASETVRRTAQLVGLNLDQIVVAGQPISEVFTKLREQLSSVKESLEGRDYVLLADILQYEVPATAQQWQQMIQAVLEQIETARQQA